MIKPFRALLVVLAIFAVSTLATAQGPATGMPTFSTVTNDFDHINLANLNVHFGFPIFSKPGRGTPFAYNLSYDSSVWAPVGDAGNQYWQPRTNWGWIAQSTALTGYISFSHYITHCKVKSPEPGGGINIYDEDMYSQVAYVDPGGTRHDFAGVDYEGPCPNTNSGFTATALDGSGYTITFFNGSGSVQGRGGVTIYPPSNNQNGPGTIIDNNGNQLSTDGAGTFTDTLGMTVLTITGTAPNPVSYTYTDTTGAARSVVVNYTTLTVHTDFNAPGIAEYGPQATSLISSIVYPDSSQYTFTYEPTRGIPGAVTGRIASISLPTGGNIFYVYSGGYNGLWADGSTAGLTRTTSTDGITVEAVTLYAQGSLGPTTSTTNAYDAQNNLTVYRFSGNYETQRQVYLGGDPGGTRIREQHSCYNGNQTDCAGASVTGPITAKTTWTLMEGYQDKAIAEAYNGFGLLTQRWEYNDAALLRVTKVSYAALGNNIVDRPALITVEDASGNQVLKTIYAYDDTPLAATSGVPQHLAINGSRGNLTHQTNVLLGNTDSSPLTTYNYDDTGNLLSIAGPGGQTTSLSYSPTLANAYATQITAPATPSANHISSTTYDINTGLPTSATDENGQKTSYSYDTMLRPYTVNTPETGQTIITQLNPTQMQTQAKVDASGRYTNRYDQVDGLGRLERTAVFNAEAPNVWDQQDYCYNPQGGQTFVTYTYQGTGWGVDKACSVKNGVISSTQPGDTTSFDVLGRPTLVKHSDGTAIQYGYKNRATSVTDEGNGSSSVERIYQTDGLGRVVSVCEVSGALLGGNGGSPVDCAQDIAGTGFLTTYEYDLLGNLNVVRQAGLFARVYNHDSLSRLTSESSPEAFNDITSYIYNPNGMVTTRVRPAPNQLNPGQTVSTTYTYDALGRATDITYDDGATPSVHNLYDVSNSYGVTAQNPVGRLVGSRTGENNNTVRVYSYDPMGRLLDNWQCTPRVCSYLLSYTYDLLGDVTSSTNGVGVTLNYAYNGAPRITGVTSSSVDAHHPAALLSGVKYGIAGPTASSLGDGLPETRTYDPRLGLQSYSAGSTYSYALTKASNGDVTAGNDSANGAWTYSYDPFSRLATASKSGQSFAYDYDRFGNRWKQRLTNGTSGSQPSYTFDGYNHITNSGFVYDALGNVTNDGVHTYTYDAENRLTQVDGGAKAVYTYDAEGRRVKAAKAGGVSSEFLYDLNGKVIVELDGASGTVRRDELFAGGQHIATYTNSTTYFHHQDWLGTKRVSTDPTGAVVETCTNLPFGDGGSCTGTNASLISFTDFDHDSESNLEHAWFRQLSTTQDRWMTPDPYGGSMDIGNPQSLNRYVYAGNDPMDSTDPFGLVTSQPIKPDAAQCSQIMDVLAIEDAVNINLPPGLGKVAGLGTVAAALAANLDLPFSAKLLSYFNSDNAENQGGLETARGRMDIDWFSTLKASSLPFTAYFMYVPEKSLSIALRKKTHQKVTNTNPFWNDPFEKTAAKQASLPWVGYNDLFPPSWLEQNCYPKPKPKSKSGGGGGGIRVPFAPAGNGWNPFGILQILMGGGDESGLKNSVR